MTDYKETGVVRNDQAAGLRSRMQAPRRAKSPTRPIVAVAGGKGGVGKTVVAVNLALALRETGRRVLLVDLDPGMADADIIMGVHPPVTLEECMATKRPLTDAVMVGPGGVLLLPGASGVESLAAPGGFTKAGLWSALETLAPHVDIMVFDTGAGLSSAVIEPLCRASRIMLVTNPEPTAVTDTYALLKVLHLRNRAGRTDLVVNRAANQEEAFLAATRLRKVSSRFLGRKPNLAGWLPAAAEVTNSVCRRAPFFAADPTSVPTREMRAMVSRLVDNLAGSSEDGVGKGQGIEATS